MFKYKKIKNFLETDFAEFIVDYFILKTNMTIDCSENQNNFLNYFFYSDNLTETILHNSCDSVNEITGMNLVQSYTYSGVYTKGDEIFNHKNKDTEKIEGFLFLGSENNKEKIYLSESDDCSNLIYEELEPGDLFLFDGHKYWHWIDSLEDKWSVRSFLYFIEKKEGNENLIYDRRPYLGFPKQYSINT